MMGGATTRISSIGVWVSGTSEAFWANPAEHSPSSIQMAIIPENRRWDITDSSNLFEYCVTVFIWPEGRLKLPSG